MQDPLTLLFGVFDGHGVKGLEAAREAARLVRSHFTSSHRHTPAENKTQAWVEAALREAFQSAQESLLHAEANSKQVLDYGTTACVAVVRPALGDLTIAWLGDARASVIRWENVACTPRIETDSDTASSSLDPKELSPAPNTPPHTRTPTPTLLATPTLSSPVQPHSPTLTSTLTPTSSSALIPNPTQTTTTTTTTTTTATGADRYDDFFEDQSGANASCSPVSSSSPAGSFGSTTTLEDTNGSLGTNPTLQLAELTNDHVPSREDEKDRVVKEGGVIRNVKGVVRVVAGGDFTEEQLKEQRLALNISRSLGHAILSKYGISSEPDVLQTTIQADDILMVASDGLWNELSSSEISSIALECKMAGFSAQKFCAMLLRRAEVVSKLKGVSSDNITIIVYHHLNP